MDNFKTRKATPEDSKRVWEIRNHPEARRISNNREEIIFEKHNYWFKNKYFNRVENYCYVLEDENKKAIGYCRFDYDKDNDNYIISIAIDFDKQGKGLGGYFLKKSLGLINIKKDIIAQTFKNNIASYKIFKNNGFKKYKEDEDNFYLKYNMTSYIINHP